MNDTEVRAALQELAERVPPSKDPWTEHERRVARSRANRRWLGVGAAAACLLLAAGIAIPTVLDRDAPSYGAGSEIGPVSVGDNYTDGGLAEYWVAVERSRNAQGGVIDKLCVSMAGHFGRRDEDRCRSAEVIDDGPALVHPMAVAQCDAEASKPTSHCPFVQGVVIATAPEVARLDVDMGNDGVSVARELGRTDRLVLFETGLRYGSVPDLVNKTFTYVARDTDGDVIDEVTLSGHDGTEEPAPAGPKAGPVEVEHDGHSRASTWVTVERTPGGRADRLCLSRADGAPTAVEVERDGQCKWLQVKDRGPAAIHPMHQCRIVGRELCVQVPAWVIATAPEVAQLEVEFQDESAEPARELARMGGIALFEIATPGYQSGPIGLPSTPTRYIARDAEGSVIDVFSR